MARSWWFLVFAAVVLSSQVSEKAEPSRQELQPHRKSESSSLIGVTPQYTKSLSDKVNALVRQYSWNSKRLLVWNESLEKMRPKILAAKDIIELESVINEALRPLNSSHTQLLTINDESFYLLHCLFASDNRAVKPVSVDFTGITTGTEGFNTVRYVLDHSPGSLAGIKRGDEILRVNEKPFIGQLSFWDTARKEVQLTLKRNGELIRVSIVPEKADLYKRYVEAIWDSVRVFKRGNHAIGYIHYWIGGKEAHEVLESALSHDLALSDGLILDLRDGYGAAWVDDLDFFFRPETAYPKEMRYSKPVVVLINDGTRSGKEALAFSLQHSGRAKLVGQRTAGAFLPGRLFPIDDRTALYLPTRDFEFMGKRLEGNGVSPDIAVAGNKSDQRNSDDQYDKAVAVLLDILDSSPTN